MASRKLFDRLLIVIGVLLLCFVLTSYGVQLLSKLFDLNLNSRVDNLILSSVQAVLLFIMPALVSARIISRKPVHFLKLDKAPSLLAVLGVIFAYLISLPALNQIAFWNSNITFPDIFANLEEMLKISEETALKSTKLILDIDSWSGLFINLLVVAFLVGFAEELFFRGTLQTVAASEGAHHTAIWIVALFFSAMHMQAYGVIPRLLFGAWFGYLLYWTGSLYVPIIAHILNNGVVVVCLWLNARGIEFDGEMFGVTEYGFPLAAFVSAVAVVAFLIFFRRFFFKSSNGGIFSAENFNSANLSVDG